LQTEGKKNVERRTNSVLGENETASAGVGTGGRRWGCDKGERNHKIRPIEWGEAKRSHGRWITSEEEKNIS